MADDDAAYNNTHHSRDEGKEVESGNISAQHAAISESSLVCKQLRIIIIKGSFEYEQNEPFPFYHPFSKIV